MSVLDDVRFALRLFRRTPGLTAIALLSTALGVGATGVVFAAIKAVLIEPLPYAHAEELVQIGMDIGKTASQGDWIFWREAAEVARRTRTLASVGIYENAVFDLAGDGSAPAEALYGLRVSASLFPTLGVAPLLGRNILPLEDRPGNARAIILSYGLWKRRFEGDPAVVGRTVKIDGEDRVVIGVMAPGFNFPLRRAATRSPYPYVEFWAPLAADPANPPQGGLGAVARLRPAVTIGQARADIESISQALAREFPSANRDRSLHVAFLRVRAIGGAEPGLLLLMAASATFLLIGCANVAQLLLARGMARRQEIAVRLSMGATGARILRQFLVESCILALAGGLGGFALTAAAWRILPALVPASIPRLASARADWTVLGFALLAAVANGMLFGIAPALRAAGSRRMSDWSDSGVREASGRRERFRGPLVAAEVAITMTLVVVGAQLAAGFVRLLETDPGFRADRILASVVLPQRERYPTPEKRAAVYRRFLNAVAAIPGVESAGTVDALPFSGENHGGFVTNNPAAALDPQRQMVAEVDVTGGRYLQTMGVRLFEGRWFRENETSASSDVAIVDQAVARRLWPHVSAVGQRLCVDCTPERPDDWKRVVGVVSGIRHASLAGPAHPDVYLAGGAFEAAAFIVARSNWPAAELGPAIRAAIARVDPRQPVLLSASLQALIGDTIAGRRFIMSLLAVMACLALAMAAAGVYGVTAYTTSRRTAEIGVRMALGATPGRIARLVFGDAFYSVVVGLALGLVSALVLVRILRGVLVGLGATRTGETVLAAALVLLTAAIACWAPTRRATRVDPMSALRHE
jgi:putative ABC transport system permease protein